MEKLSAMKNQQTKRCLAWSILLFLLASMPVSAAPGYDQVAKSTTTKDIGKYGMTPIYGSAVKDGTYELDVESSSSFFKIMKAELTVKDGVMTAVMEMYSNSYLYVYPGTAEEAAAAAFEDYISLEKEEYSSSFTIPVRALNDKIPCAAFSEKKEKWYDRELLFDAAELPEEVFAFKLPDYERIEDAILLYDEQNGTDTKAEETETADRGTEGMADAAGKNSKEPEAVSMEEGDGEYSIEVDMTGGSERASVTSPTWLYVKDGKAYAKLLWSSMYYDYMLIDGKKYLNETTDGSNSTFTIPITVLDEPMNVIADTTAMGDPVEIEYALTFYADTVGSVSQIPQEAAKKVLVLAIAIILLGGILNHFVKKRRR